MALTCLSFTLTFFLGYLGLATNRKYLLSALLCLELVMFSLYMNLAMWSYQTGSNTFFPTPMILLTFSACEASTGLALMVATTRTHGTTQLNNLNTLKC